MRPRYAPFVLLALLVSGALALTGCSSRSQSTTTTVERAPARVHQVATRPTRTVVHTFTGYRADGSPAVASTSTVRGYCWNPSLAASGPKAFRCFSGSTILDPCFAPPSPGPAALLCVNDPWSRATTLRLTRVLPAAVPALTQRPWAVQLATGARCVAATGTVPQVAGVNLDYRCSDGTAAALQPGRSPLVSAVYADPDASALTDTTVAALWRT